jgi:dephospho-CoA kinase
LHRVAWSKGRTVAGTVPGVLLVGLTGGIGSGKSTVAGMLAARGAVIVDADQIARELAEPGGAVYRPMIDRFGEDIVLPDGTIDRAKVARQVFSDPRALADLNAISHPKIREELGRRVLDHAASDRIVVMDVPLLAETTRKDWGLAAILVVDTPVDLAVHRLVAQRAMSEDDARARVARQASREDRSALADVVIANGGSLDQLEEEVDRAWAWLTAKLRHSA